MPPRTSPSNDAPLSANRRPAKAAAQLSGEAVLAEQHRKMAEPGLSKQ